MAGGKDLGPNDKDAGFRTRLPNGDFRSKYGAEIACREMIVRSSGTNVPLCEAFTFAAVLALLIVIQRGSLSAQSTAAAAAAPAMCNYSKVINVQSGHFLSVRSGPGTRFRRIDQLSLGKEVYVCSEHFYWYEVFYSDPNVPNSPCDISSPKGLDVNEAKRCKSGWVQRDWIDVISG